MKTTRLPVWRNNNVPSRFPSLSSCEVMLYGVASRSGRVQSTPAFDFMIEDTNTSRLPLTKGEHDRAEIAAHMLDFAKAEMPDVSGTVELSGPPTNWDEPKTSLLAHPVVSLYVRILASQAALNCYWRLDHFELLHPEAYLTELLTARDQCADAKLAAQYQTRAEVWLDYRGKTPNVRAELLEHGTAFHQSAVNAANSALRCCKRIVGEWHQLIPSEKCRELLAELERLESETLAPKLKFFGLGDLMEN